MLTALLAISLQVIFSQTPLGSDFPMSYVDGLRCSPAATGRFDLEQLPDLKTEAGLNISGELVR